MFWNAKITKPPSRAATVPLFEGVDFAVLQAAFHPKALAKKHFNLR